MNKHDQLKYLLSLSLDEKIKLSTGFIREWYNRYNGNVVVSFSGGMDSTVLLHLVRRSYPDVAGITVKSLLYPEVLDHVRRTENIELLCPGMPFGDVIQKYGYPVISKRNAQYISEVQNSRSNTNTKRLRLTGIRPNGTINKIGMISTRWKYLVDAPFKIGHKCCDVLKKGPFDSGLMGRFPFIGTRTNESTQREQTYYLHGVNAYNLKRPRSTPLSFWTDSDIWEYIRSYSIPYSSIYDMGYTRTGCFACMFGVHLEHEPNRFQRMQKTHPKLWRACEGWGIPGVLDYIGVNYEAPQQPLLFEYAASGKLCEW